MMFSQTTPLPKVGYHKRGLIERSGAAFLYVCPFIRDDTMNWAMNTADWNTWDGFCYEHKYDGYVCFEHPRIQQFSIAVHNSQFDLSRLFKMKGGRSGYALFSLINITVMTCCPLSSLTGPSTN